MTAPAMTIRTISEGAVNVTLRERVALLELNVPDKHNALSASLVAELDQALRWVYSSPEVGVAVLTGSDVAFSAGGDIAVFDNLDVESGYRFTRKGYDLLRRMETQEKPIIAAVEGHCIAGGLELALACDFILAGEGARFGLTEVNLGLIPGWGGTVRLSRAIPVRRARRMLYTGEFLDVAQALSVGLISEVADRGQATYRALEIASAIASKPALAVQMLKMVTTAASDAASYEAALAVERTACAALFGTDEVGNLARAWLNSRSEKENYGERGEN